MNGRAPIAFVRRFLRFLLVAGGAAVLSVGCFLILPILQEMSASKDTRLETYVIDTLNEQDEPEPEPEEPEEEEEQEEPEPPPPVAPDATPPDISSLDLILGDGSGLGGALAGIDLAEQIKGLTASGDSEDSLGLGAIERRPRATFRQDPVLTPAVRRKAPGAVLLKIMVDARGRVTQARVERSDDPVFNKPALDAIRKWKFEPGTRNGKPAVFRIKQPIRFPEL